MKKKDEQYHHEKKDDDCEDVLATRAVTIGIDNYAIKIPCLQSNNINLGGYCPTDAGYGLLAIGTTTITVPAGETRMLASTEVCGTSASGITETEGVTQTVIDTNTVSDTITNTITDTDTVTQTQTLTDIIITTTTDTVISTPTPPIHDAGTCYLSNLPANNVIGALLSRTYSYPQSATTAGTNYAFSYDQCVDLCVASPQTTFKYFSLTQDKTTSTGQTKYYCSCYSKFTPGRGTGSCGTVTVNGVAYTYGNNGSEFVFELT
ncbi:hypothetical protein NQZ79_g8106 [Umbelopsis isabellina]|nr:hypothetical protein NQZ79_g8106 [Umbelopsis isabellina]